MDISGTRTVLLAAVLAGLIAGLVVGLFHSVATEPVIERAIALEEASHAGQMEAPPVVTRDVQRVGLVVGYLLYGVFMGLVFGAVFALVRPRFPGVGRSLNALLAALAAYWLVALLPFLKYPANPPGVGDAETIGYRQALMLLFWVLSVGGVLLAGWVYRLLQGRLGGRGPLAVALLTYGLYAAVLLVAMPANPDAVTMPGDLVASFRALSVVGLTLFWLVLGALFGWLLSRARPAAAEGTNGAPTPRPAAHR